MATPGPEPPEERPGALLGTDDVQTPAGPVAVERLKAQEANRKTVEEELLPVLRELGDKFEFYADLQYRPGAVREQVRGGSVAGFLVRKLSRLRRAQNPNYERNQRVKFEALRTRALSDIAQRMQLIAGEITALDPSVHEFEKVRMRDAAERIGKVEDANFKLELARHTINLARLQGVEVTPEMQREIERSALGFPDPTEMQQSQAKLRAARINMAGVLSAEEIRAAGYDPTTTNAMLRARKEHLEDRRRTRETETGVDKFFEIGNLNKRFEEIRKFHFDDLSQPDFIMGAGGMFTSAMREVPLSSKMMREGTLRSIWQMRREILGLGRDPAQVFAMMGRTDELEMLMREEANPDREDAGSEITFDEWAVRRNLLRSTQLDELGQRGAAFEF